VATSARSHGRSPKLRGRMRVGCMLSTKHEA
jgi:hypothetical protein